MSIFLYLLLLPKLLRIFFENFTVGELEDQVCLRIKEGVTLDILREKFRVNIDYDVLWAFVHKDAVETFFESNISGGIK